ncbi:MAG: sigma-70 family RNA polymerase sigma factor [Dysgonomonadaceae bacterium]|jgi:RNA polymerase sigma-70 factor (ECF subfamily)|nr:sigma-70 family RNA polymerase sigma factor [Dysgonamonadaceae bacterium]PLB86387.1 RNA polymerase [Dysgonamonadaceae bacterium]HOV36953.1 sigma-70 family RNA polymerase sigma factor [Dysgonamonadaceae bacterium]HQG08640.1 sigma-70 family RNA polymerase sigma factor [Dysgonamonadaceae bacterium]HQI44148.1 sigma-70 family RNA polymerase sigma factor [Dysgonamonadaceae bacterium]
MDDSQLIKACKRQDRKAQQMLYEKYAKKMMAICLRYSKDEETAYDLLHDGFIQVFSHIGSFEGKGSFEGWLKRIFVNVALMYLRKEQKRGEIRFDIEQMESEPIEEDDDDEGLLSNNISQQQLLALINALPLGYKTVFNLFVFEDKTHKEIANTLGISEASSRSQYSRARALLKKQINAVIKKNGERPK